MSALVVDTSSWVGFFREGRSAAAIEEALAVGAVFVPPIVCAELLSAPLNKAERARLVEFLEALPLCASTLEHWVRVGLLRAGLAKRGIVVSTPDAHVAQCALDLDAPLLTEDKIFRHVSRNTSLRLR